MSQEKNIKNKNIKDKNQNNNNTSNRFSSESLLRGFILDRLSDENKKKISYSN